MHPETGTSPPSRFVEGAALGEAVRRVIIYSYAPLIFGAFRLPGSESEGGRSMAPEARDLRVAAVQMESENCRIEANLEHATGFAEDAARQGAKLVVFPEFMPTGYIFAKEIWDAGEPSDGPTAAWLGETSKRLGIWLGTSFLEAVGEDFFNTFVLSDPNGQEAGRVRKQSPAAVEAYFFKGEGGSHVIDTAIGVIGVGICYENQLAYMPRLMCSRSADIVLMPHSAPSPTPTPVLRRKMLDTYVETLRELPAFYARSLGVPVVFVNKSGPFRSPTPGLPFYPQNSSFPGDSAIVDSDGSVRARLGREEGVIVADIRLDPARKTGAPPPSSGRWAKKLPWEINFFRVAEFSGRNYYRFSGERRRRARAISGKRDRAREARDSTS